MAEIKTLVEGKLLKYEGLVNVKELYSVIDKWFEKHRYDKAERRNYEQVFKDCKLIEMELHPYKKISDYAKFEFKIDIVLSDLTEVEVERNNVKMKLWKGKVEIKFTAYFITDYEDSWETKPFYYFVRTLTDKFIYRSYNKKMEVHLIDECQEIFDEVRSFLNMSRYS
ncbi:MAG: hypothetical protein ABIC91_00485 [Nanoarchaeota archaeon]|nr:hypothetical protein [Nanoarchaeota archaeon]MBU1030213.1 hypothetical protein [Nanoarchaeota archaeon]MBU1850595.1 hypothetical protein [Nanoarchaeota archaeon]